MHVDATSKVAKVAKAVGLFTFIANCPGNIGEIWNDVPVGKLENQPSVSRDAWDFVRVRRQEIASLAVVDPHNNIRNLHERTVRSRLDYLYLVDFGQRHEKQESPLPSEGRRCLVLGCICCLSRVVQYG